MARKQCGPHEFLQVPHLQVGQIPHHHALKYLRLLVGPAAPLQGECVLIAYRVFSISVADAGQACGSRSAASPADAENANIGPEV